MKLVNNWKAIATRSHSMWSIYLGVIVLLVPDILYLLFRLDTSPRLWFVLGLVLLIYGVVLCQKVGFDPFDLIPLN